MECLDEMHHHFGVKIQPGVVGSVGWMLQFVTHNKMKHFMINHPKDLARLFIIDKPVIVVDGNASLRQFTNVTNQIRVKVGTAIFTFRLRSISAYSSGHWTTFVDTNDQGSCDGVKLDVGRLGLRSEWCSGQEYLNTTQQRLYVYEMQESLLASPKYQEVAHYVRDYMRRTVVQFLSLQQHEDTSQYRKDMMDELLEQAGVANVKQLSDNPCKWDIFALLQAFSKLLAYDRDVWHCLKMFFEHACIKDYSQYFS
jgi:hypothetical protein